MLVDDAEVYHTLHKLFLIKLFVMFVMNMRGTANERKGKNMESSCKNQKHIKVTCIVLRSEIV